MIPAPSPDRIGQRAWSGYQRMSIRLFSQLNRELVAATGISLPDYEVLEVLESASDNRLRSNELGTELQWEKSRLSHHLKRMENRHLVDRITCESDGRGLWVSLTDSGRVAIERATAVRDDYVKRHFVDVLTPENLVNIAEASEKVIADLPGDTNLCDL